jgi:hypothetical protein
LSTDGNSDRETGKTEQQNIIQEISSHYNNTQSFPYQNGKPKVFTLKKIFLAKQMAEIFYIIERICSYGAARTPLVEVIWQDRLV